MTGVRLVEDEGRSSRFLEIFADGAVDHPSELYFLQFCIDDTNSWRKY